MTATLAETKRHVREQEGLRKPERVAPYRSNPRDIAFNLFEVFGRDKLLGRDPFREFTVADARDTLREMDNVAREVIAPTLLHGDRNPPTFDPKTNSVTTDSFFNSAYQTLMAQEFYRAGISPEIGGANAPRSFSRALSELSLGANPAMHFYTLGPEMAEVLNNIGNEQQKNVAKIMVDRQWGATMVLTEPDAGSNVGAAKAKALPQPDGTWHIEGVKRFITSGDHDMSENILHFVLARRPDAPVGTKGLSLFMVPKFLFDQETGEIGERNGVYATGLEDKMGIKASATCEMTFGGDKPAVGCLVGDVHDGIRQMFEVIENARMMIGIKSMGTLSRAYLDVVDYAKQRKQGPDMTQMLDKHAEQVAIIDHPEIRRSLLMQKAYAEGLRALIHYTTTFQDDMQIAKSEGRVDKRAEGINDLLLPVVKGFGSERVNELLQDALQVYGGAGFMKDFPMEQYIRDAKIDTIYEGTTAIQSMDFYFRKIVKDNKQALTTVLDDVKNFADGDGILQVERQRLGEAATHFQAMVDLQWGATWEGFGADPQSLYKVGRNNVRLLESFGDLLIGYLLLRQAEVSNDMLPTAQDKDRAFYIGKIATARFFAEEILPRLESDRKIMEATTQPTALNLMDIPHDAF